MNGRMSEDLIERLRAKDRRYDLETGGGMAAKDATARTWSNGQIWEPRNPDGEEAAAEIERLKAIVESLPPLSEGVERLVEALKPFAEWAGRLFDSVRDDDIIRGTWYWGVAVGDGAENGFCAGDLRRAREALSSFNRGGGR